MMEKNRESIEFTLFTRENLRINDLLNRCVSSLYTFGKDFAPVEFEVNGRWKPINWETLNKSGRKWEKKDSILFRRESKYQSEISFLLSTSPSTQSIISCWIEEAFFEDSKNINSFIDFSKKFYSLLKPSIGFVHSTESKLQMATIYDPKFGKTVIPVNLNKGLPAIYWANFINKEYVEKLGRDKILSASWFKVEEFEDGGVLALTGSSPLICKNIDFILGTRKIQEFLGKENFYP